MAKASKKINLEIKNGEQTTQEGIEIRSGWHRYANREEAKAAGKLKRDSSSQSDYYRKRAVLAAEVARAQRKQKRREEPLKP